MSIVSRSLRSLQRLAYGHLPLRRGHNRLISESGLFDQQWYLQQYPEVASSGYDPIVHYLRKGHRGYNPNPYFQSTQYLARNPMLWSTGVNPLVHYIVSGHRTENPGPLFDVASYARLNNVGRDRALQHYLSAQRQAPGLAPFSVDRQRETVLVVSHDATRTGAPVIALAVIGELKRRQYNVLAFLLGGGGLEWDFRREADHVIGPIVPGQISTAELAWTVTTAIGWLERAPRFAVVNSVESRAMLAPLTHHAIATISLVHEFVSARPVPTTGLECARWSNHIVFPAAIVRDDALAHVPALSPARVSVYPQGPSPMPPSNSPDDAASLQRALQKLQSVKRTRQLVLGAGTVEARKGIDEFLQCADALRSFAADAAHFAWFGSAHGDRAVIAHLSAEIARLRLADHVSIDDAVPQLDAVYDVADVFFLSSKLDPLPNVALDAMRKGIPVVCFDGTGGIPELLRTLPNAAQCVAPAMDVMAAARTIARLLQDPEFHQAVSGDGRAIASRLPSAIHYVDRIEALAEPAREECEAETQDVATIAADPTFDARYYPPPGASLSRAQAIRDYVRGWTSGILQRKPCPGFLPHVFAAHNPWRGPSSGQARNPLARFIREGRPPGPWTPDFVDLDQPPPAAPPPSCAIHVHGFYPELMPDILKRLARSRCQCRILISTDTPDKAQRIGQQVAASGLRALIRIFPNRGRNIGPLLLGFRSEFQEHDIIGHLHTKATAWIGDALVGAAWRQFLFDNLVGNDGRVMASILGAFQREPQLGLVFAADPNLLGWDDNAAAAMPLLASMGIAAHLSSPSDFPVGTMFWARRAAVAPLFKLVNRWEDLPPEPLATDGSMLHAIERLLPIVAAHTGYRCKLTHVAGTTR